MLSPIHLVNLYSWSPDLTFWQPSILLFLQPCIQCFTVLHNLHSSKTQQLGLHNIKNVFLASSLNKLEGPDKIRIRHFSLSNRRSKLHLMLLLNSAIEDLLWLGAVKSNGLIEMLRHSNRLVQSHTAFEVFRVWLMQILIIFQITDIFSVIHVRVLTCITAH